MDETNRMSMLQIALNNRILTGMLHEMLERGEVMTTVDEDGTTLWSATRTSKPAVSLDPR